MEKIFDQLIVVSADQENQIKRLRKRNSWSEDEIQKRIARQISLAEKVKKAHFVIHNHGSVDELEEQVDKMLKFLDVPTKHKHNPR